tara:strand:- start:1757 stop:2173 length:417 start_codon:yes stop_codon:yes gene_type:complete
MQHDNRNKGALFDIKKDNDLKVIKQGKINMEGVDRRVIAVSRKNAMGKPITSLYEEIANISPYEGNSEKSPNGKGFLDIRKLEKTKSVGVWKRKSQQGNEYWSLSLSDYEPKGKHDATNDTVDNDNTHLSEIEDDIPF